MAVVRAWCVHAQGVVMLMCFQSACKGKEKKRNGKGKRQLFAAST
jgi:hypothetical protein